MITVAGHFGEWLQGRLGAQGPVALITLPCPALRVRIVSEGIALFDPEHLRGFLRDLGVPGDPLPQFACDMPLGGGAGASTAGLVAAARWAGYAGDDLALACLRAEGASDPLMFDHADQLLWASREGRVIRQMPAPPRAEIIGGFWGAPERTDPKDTDFADITDLVERWSRAGGLIEFARLATQSALRCYAVRGGADPLQDLARDLGALGIVRAHTGSARGLIFAPQTVPQGARSVLQEAGFTHITQFETGGPR